MSLTKVLTSNSLNNYLSWLTLYDHLDGYENVKPDSNDTTKFAVEMCDADDNIVATLGGLNAIVDADAWLNKIVEQINREVEQVSDG